MYTIDFSHPIHIHFIGIGGISMSGLAQILLKEGFQISGSDAHESALTQALAQQGAQIMIGQSADNIRPGYDLVVYTAAIHPDNPEFAAAEKAGIPMLSRAQLLGQMMRNYRSCAAVAGTHGKTTTTSMLSHITMQARLDPTISVGGILKSIGGNIRVGGSDLFITEACEYTNSFLSFFPTIGIILNIDADHLDFFKDLDDIRRSFRKFAQLLPEDGTLIISGDIPDLAEFTQGLPCRVITFGGEECVCSAGDIAYDSEGCASFTLGFDGQKLGTIRLRVPGEHNVGNALAAAAAAIILGIGFEDIKEGLYSFTGTDRRFEHRGECAGFTIIDDYAHHPTEIRATLTAAKGMSSGEIWCIFQPHTYTRTKALMDDFAEALSLADHVILAEIYPARETDNLGISSRTLMEKICALGADACCPGDFSAIETFVRENVKPGDLLLTMGAGDVVKIADDLTDSADV